MNILASPLLSIDDCVSFTMYDYIEDILKEAANDMNGTAVTNASDNLFKVNKAAARLD